MDTQNEMKVVFQISGTPQIEEVIKKIIQEKPRVLPDDDKDMAVIAEASAAGIAICCNG